MAFSGSQSRVPVCRGTAGGKLRDVLHPAILPTVLAAGIVLTVLSAMAVRKWERTMAREKAGEVVHERVEKLEETGLRSMEVLHSIDALYQAYGQISRVQFRNFVRQALARQPELRALSWNPRVPAAMRDEMETAARNDGEPNFEFREAGPGKQLVPETRRAEYVPIYYIEPPNGNVAALGYDLGSDTCRRQSLEKARDTGQATATAPIHLTQEKDQRPGLLVLLPIYQGGVPKTTEERRAKLAGFSVAVFEVADLVARAFDELESKGIHARLFDQSRSGELIYSGPRSSAEAFPSGSPQALLEIAGRPWLVEFAPGTAFILAQPHDQSLLILAGGLAFTFLITAHLYGGWRRTREIAAANAQLQDEVVVRQKAEAAAAAANRAKSDFLASMSHEIRTPLNAILGYAQLMQHDHGLSPEQRDAVRSIGCNGRHLIELINEILDLSKIEAGRMELHDGDFDLGALGRGLQNTFRPLCAQKRIGLRFAASSGKAGDAQRVRGDESKLRQVLLNLVGNAVKFTSAGEVYFGFTRVSGDRWLFEVVDTGLGIPEEEQADIFKPFHQGANAAHQGGTGLGLAIALRQVEFLGGTLQLQSERGIGSRFFFEIPLAQPAGAAAAAAPTAGLARLKPGHAARVLVADDRKENCDVLEKMLSRAGCRVWVSQTCAEAIEKCRQERPDIVFLDFIMPGMGGVAAARAILSDPACGFPKIIAHSAAAVPGNRELARQAGCVDFLSKPVLSEDVYECLRKHLGVEFDVSETAPVLEIPRQWQGGQIFLPDELHHRLVTAAELHSTTTLKACLHELRKLDTQAIELAEHIRHLMRSYDMDGILRLICQATTPAFSTANCAAPHGLDPNDNGSS